MDATQHLSRSNKDPESALVLELREPGTTLLSCPVGATSTHECHKAMAWTTPFWVQEKNLKEGPSKLGPKSRA